MKAGNGDKEYYEGDIVNNKRHGNGKMTTKEGHVYEGKFSNGKLLRGKLTMKNGVVYEGEFDKNGRMTGKGVMVNGKRKYDGEFENGKMMEGEIFDEDLKKKGYICEVIERVHIPEGDGERDYLLHSFVNENGLQDYDWLENMDGEVLSTLSYFNGILKRGIGKEYHYYDLNNNKKKIDINQLFYGNDESIDDRLNPFVERSPEDLILICPGLNLKNSLLIEVLIVGDGLYNDDCGDISKMKMDLSEFKKLKRIELGNKCFKHVREFVVDGLESLESVKFGRHCFRISWEERNDGLCRITNCPNLRQLEIGNNCFFDFKSFELSNVNSLQSIEFGWKCFEYTDFSLKGE